VSRTIVVSGALANKPNNGGEALVRLAWVRGFQQLGFRVCFIEQIAKPTCVDAGGNVVPFERSINLAYFKQVTRDFGLAESAALIYDDGAAVYGLAEDDIDAATSSADLLVNISGHLQLPRLMKRIRRKAYVDIDPGYTQIWHGQKLLSLGEHDVYFTIGQNIGTPDCSIPTGGIDWKHTRPLAAALDPANSPPRADRFTTVAAWRGSFGGVTYNGRTFGQKAHEFRKVIELPARSPHTFEIALQIHSGDAKDRAALEANRWKLVDPATVASTPRDFRRYVRESSAEFSVAQGIYVETNSGWFSDRTVQYLAAGRPVLVQDTGYRYGRGVGLVPYRTLDEAVARADGIVAAYDFHSREARGIAEVHFGAEAVLGPFLADAGVAA